jgi:hypothetical protein
MGTVSVVEGRPARRFARGDVAKLAASPPRGVIGTGLLLLVSLFLLAAGAFDSAPEGDWMGSHDRGAFILDPSISSAQG